MVPGPTTRTPGTDVAAGLSVTGAHPHDILPGAASATTPTSQTSVTVTTLGRSLIPKTIPCFLVNDGRGEGHPACPLWEDGGARDPGAVALRAVRRPVGRSGPVTDGVTGAGPRCPWCSRAAGTVQALGHFGRFSSGSPFSGRQPGRRRCRAGTPGPRGAVETLPKSSHPRPPFHSLGPAEGDAGSGSSHAPHPYLTHW